MLPRPSWSAIATGIELLAIDESVVYFDANASSRLRPEVEQVFTELFGNLAPKNPSSVHTLGRLARSRLQSARKAVLRLANGGTDSHTQRLIFTAGGTEACNQMLFGFLGPLPQLGLYPAKVVTSAIEHPSVLEPLSLLERCGWTIARVRPGRDGMVRAEDFIAAVEKDTALVALMAANNETGALQPIKEIAASLRANGFNGIIVSDFIQALAKTELTAAELFKAGVNAISISGHKLGAPSGIGALIVNTDRSAVCHSYEPLLRGGAQEQGFRAGTENLLGALAFGRVAESTLASLDADLKERRRLRDLLWSVLSENMPGTERLTPADRPGEIRSLSNTLCVRFDGCRADDLVVALDLEGLAASTGSACSSGKQALSHVISAMGFEDSAARQVIRFSLDWDADEAAVLCGAEIIRRAVEHMRLHQTAQNVASAA